jgi:hypothetical protein
MTKTQPLTRHIISINDLSNKEIETIFEVAQGLRAQRANQVGYCRLGRLKCRNRVYSISVGATARAVHPSRRAFGAHLRMTDNE